MHMSHCSQAKYGKTKYRFVLYLYTAYQVNRIGNNGNVTYNPQHPCKYIPDAPRNDNSVTGMEDGQQCGVTSFDISLHIDPQHILVAPDNAHLTQARRGQRPPGG